MLYEALRRLGCLPHKIYMSHSQRSLELVSFVILEDLSSFSGGPVRDT